MSDYYDRAVEYFCKRPKEVDQAWDNGDSTTVPYALLFSYVSPLRTDFIASDVDGGCGCPAMIRGGSRVHPSAPDGLVADIRLDQRIPRSQPQYSGFTGEFWEPIIADPDKLRSALTAFADWQRRIDKELGRAEPAGVQGDTRVAQHHAT